MDGLGVDWPAQRQMRRRRAATASVELQLGRLEGASPRRATAELRTDDLAREDADVLDLGLDTVTGLQEIAGRRADAVRRAGRDDVAGQERQGLGEHLAALRDGGHHIR